MLERIDRHGRSELDHRALRSAVLAEIRREVPFDAHVWLLLDPDTLVGWSPLAEVPLPDGLPSLVRARYLARSQRWTDLPPGEARSLAFGPRAASGADPWQDLLAAVGVDDVATVVVGDRFGIWGCLDLWRTGGTFSADECSVLGEVARRVALPLRRRLAATFVAPWAHEPPPGGPAVLLLTDDLGTVTQTTATEGHLRRLLPTDPGRLPVPAAAYNVAAQLLAREAGVDDHPPWARMQLDGASWSTVRAGRLVGAPAGGASIAVSFEECPPAERAALFARVVGLSAREAEVLEQVALGRGNQEIARRLFVSEHTVQDHLKAVFDKSGTRDRRTLAARATGVLAGP